MAHSPCERCGGLLRDSHGQAVLSRRSIAPVEFLRGFVTLFSSCLFLFNRPEFAGKLRGPFLANFIVVLVAFFGMFFGLRELFEAGVSMNWGWLEWIRPAGSWLASALAIVLAAVSMFLLAPVLIETVMGPFLDPLADTTEKIYGGSKMQSVDPGVWRSAVGGVRSSAQILIIQLVVLPVSLLLSLTGIGAILAILLAAILNAVVWFEIPTVRRGINLGGRLKVIRRNWPAALGLGLAFQIGLLIPLFNFLLLTPAVAVAVSKLYLRFDKS